MVWPLWQAAPEQYLVRFSGDGAKALWFYEYVLRVVTGEASPWYTEGFDFPDAQMRGRQYPTLADGLLVLPATAALDGLTTWVGVQTIIVLANAFGFALFARALGARHLGVVLAGLLGAWCLPAWYELYQGRANAAWPGLAGASVGLGALMLERCEGDWRVVLRRALPLGLLSIPVFAAAGAMYPPYAILMAPIAMALWPWRAWSADRLQTLVLVVVAGAAFFLAWGDLQLLWMFVAETDEGGACLTLERMMPLDHWWTPSPGSNRFLRHVPTGAWILAPIGLLARPRLTAVVTFLLALLMVPLSLGNCPNASLDVPLFAQGSVWAERAYQVWETGAGPVHDSGRYSIVACLLAAGLAGAGLEQLVDAPWVAGRLRLRVVGGLVALGLAGGAAWNTAEVSLGELSQEYNWAADPDLQTRAFLETLPEGSVLAELPMRGTDPFLLATLVPGHERVASIGTPDRARDSTDPRDFLVRLGTGQEPEGSPSAEDWARTHIDWIIVDPRRCRGTMKGPCTVPMTAAIIETLGDEGQLIGEDARAWHVGSRPVP